MSVRWSATLLALCLVACAHSAADQHDAALPAKRAFDGPLPDIEVQELDGQPARLRDFTKGRVAVIDMWASWCGPCRDVAARAAELAKTESQDKLAVVGVDEGEDLKDVQAFLTAKPAYPIFVDSTFELANEIGSETVPTLLIVDRAGRVRAVTHKLDARAVHLVGELLAEGASSSREN